MKVIGTAYYLMPGDDKKVTKFQQVFGNMYTPRKQMKWFRIWSGFDLQFTNAKRVNRREINLEATYPPTNLRDDSVPFISEVLAKNKRLDEQHERIRPGDTDCAIDEDWNDYDGYYDKDYDPTEGQAASQNKVDTSQLPQ